MLSAPLSNKSKSAAAGFDVICTPSVGNVSMNCALTLTVDEVKESSGAVSIPAGKLVLSLAKTASEDKLAAVKALKAGDAVEVSITSAQQWQDVQFAVGSLYKLVTNGVVETGLNASYEPRTAIGLKPDGEWHTYRITKTPDTAWCGMLRTLRFDFGTAGDTVELDWIRIQSK